MGTDLRRLNCVAERRLHGRQSARAFCPWIASSSPRIHQAVMPLDSLSQLRLSSRSGTFAVRGGRFPRIPTALDPGQVSEALMKSVWTACRAGLIAAISAALLAVGMGAPAGAATTTIGQLGSSNECGAVNADWVQAGVGAGTSYTVPAGAWNVTSWSTQPGGALAGSLQLEIWRPTGTPDQFQLVGISPVGTTGTTGTSTFDLATPIAVQGGDLLGLRTLTSGYHCVNALPGSSVNNGAGNATAPVPGDVKTLGLAGSYVLNVTATLDDGLTPVAPTTPVVPATPVAAPAVVASPTFTG